MRRAAVVLLAVVAVLSFVSAAGAKVLRVGIYHGITGQFTSIQAAVNAAKPGDWILVGPGDYKTSSNRHPRGRADIPAGVLMTTRRVYLRGMNRNTVVVDGTKPGSAKCSSKASAQNFGPQGHGGRVGLNGIMVWKAADVWVQNLTACNFLGGSGGDGGTGNEIWWNGGDGSAKVGGHGYYGSYLTATSTYFNRKQKPAKAEVTAAEYGIFSSNWSGGTWDQTYASNFNDSGYYIGACQQVCDQTIDHAWGQYNALGYSGSNSGGKLVIENSEFDNNENGFDTNSQNGDEPSPQNGACPGNGTSPVTHTHSCLVFMHNYVHDNNNPNVPSAGNAAAGPVGTGIVVAGGRNDTVMGNRVISNDAWGVIFVPWPDQGPPCTGGTLNFPLLGAGGCLYDDWGDALINNVFGHNGSYGNPTNGDFAELNLEPGHPTDCYAGNTEEGGASLTSSPANLQQLHPSCDGSPAAADSGPFLGEVYCDSQLDLALCLPTDRYPRRTRATLHPLPKGLPTMPHPCAGVPSNPWCPARGKQSNPYEL
jgi:hypothetical protein